MTEAGRRDEDPMGVSQGMRQGFGVSQCAVEEEEEVVDFAEDARLGSTVTV